MLRDAFAERATGLERFEQAYQHAKAALLEDAVARRLTVDAAPDIEAPAQAAAA